MSGGDTMWVSLQAAYDALGEPVRAMCDQLIAWHHDPWFAADVEAQGGYEWDGRHHDKLFPVSHPVVRTHPETGRNGLFVNSQFTRFLEGVSKVESDSLLDMLYRHCQRPEFSCRYHWEPGAVAFWDNRATLALRARRLRRRPPDRPPGHIPRRPSLRPGPSPQARPVVLPPRRSQGS